MAIELLAVATKETRGMTTRVVFKLNSRPSPHWLDTFLLVPGIQVTQYPRDMFQFDKDTVACTFMGPRLSEAFETLKLYIADANKKCEDAAQMGATRRQAREVEDARRRQTESLSKELFGDDEPK